MLNGLKRRGARWSLRRRVPAEFVLSWGKGEVTRALGTSDYKVACKRLPKVWGDLDDEFAAKHAQFIGAEQGKPSDLSDPHIIAARLLPKLRARRDAAAAEGRLAEFNQQMADFLQFEQAVLDGQEENFDGLPCHEGKRNALRAVLSGDGALSIPVEAALAIEAIEDNPKFSELHELWLRQGERPRSTVKNMARAVGRFIFLVGDKRVKAINRRDVTAFADRLREPGAVNERGVTIPSTNTELSLVSALLGFAVKRNLTLTNSARGTQLKDARRPREKRREFDAPALRAIFGSPIYAADERPEGGAGEAAYWLPLLGLYTGARINELCQLEPGDVVEEGYSDSSGKPCKAWVIRFEHDRAKGKSLKTDGSERRVPVHSTLTDLGFIRYVESQRGKPLLFDELTYSPTDQNVSSNWGRWWGRKRKGWGVTDDRMTFHSFRHTFKHHVRRCLVSKDVNDMFTGHETGDSGDDYGGMSYPLAPLVEGMKRYRVDDFIPPRPPPAFR